MLFINRTAINVSPTLLIGCGGRGTAAVEYCNRLVLQELFPGDIGEYRLGKLPILRFVAIDSNLQGVDGGYPHHLEPIEIAAPDIEDALNDLDYPAAGSRPVRIRRIMPPNRDYKGVLNRLPGFDEGNCTCPPIGAMNFLLSWESIRNDLKTQLRTWQKAIPNDLPFQCASFETQKTIFIVAGLYGGTGCGIHLHTAAIVRDLLRELEITNVSTCGIFFLPDIVQDATPYSKKKLRANAYAALKEMDYFLSGNPFVLELGDRVVQIENDGTDFLFHNVFFVNDRNLESQRLTAAEATEMAGEFMFHRCATSFGPYLNQRLTDAPNAHHNSLAPMDDSRYRSGQRITAYSTFGLATATIPYETLRWNLTVDFAQELMNALLFLPDHDDTDEQQKVRLQREGFRTSALKGDGLLQELGLTIDKLLKAPGFGMKQPDFLAATAVNEQLNDYMTRTGCRTLAEVLAGVKKQIGDTLPSKPIEEEAIATLETSLRAELDRKKNSLIKSGGPELTRQIFATLHDALRAQQQKIQKEADTKAGADVIQLRVRAAETFLQQQKENSINRKSLRQKFQSAHFRLIKEACSTRLKCERAARMLPVLERINSVFKEYELSLSDENSRFMDIHRLIASKRLPYKFPPRLFNAVANDALLSGFVENFRYPAGNAPEDAAEMLRQAGLWVNGEIIQVPYLDDHPDRQAVVDAILAFAKKQIDDFGTTLWTRAFTESRFFPQEEAGAGVEGQNAVPDNAYRRVFDGLISRSAPFLEYGRGEKFDIHSTTILLHPTRIVGFDDIESQIWRSFPWPAEQHFLFAEGQHKNHSLTCFQFHFGLPLYSIDEIEEWKQNYEFLLKSDNIPLHKVHMPMPEPYINVAGENGYTDSNLRICLDWALGNSGLYPVFSCIDPPLLDALEDPAVQEFYLILRENEFIDRTDLEEILRAQAIILPPLVATELKRLLGLSGKEDRELYLSLAMATDKVPPLLECFDRFTTATLPSDVFSSPLIRCRHDGTKWIFFIAPEITADERLRNTLSRRFQNPLSKPVFKTGIDKDTVLNEIKSNAAFRDRFVAKCLEAATHLRLMGQPETSFPEALREKEA
jgi:hypothetical protein